LHGEHVDFGRILTMQRILVILVASLGLVSQAAAQTSGWTRLEEAPRRFQARFDDVFFVNPDVGWIVTTSGDVYRTTDGGQDWTRLVSGASAAFRSIGFVDTQHGFLGALSFAAVLLETLDGGVTWSNITSRVVGPTPAGICGISVVDEDHIFGVGRFNGPAVFVKTTDGGQSWTSKDMSPLAGTLVDVHFFNANEGIAVGGSSSNLGSGNRAVVLATSDGGETWSQRHITGGPNSEWGWKISFPSRFVGYVSVEYASASGSGTPAKVLKTVDGGAKWIELAIPLSRESQGLQGLGFVTNSLGWAGGRGTTTQSDEGGSSWHSHATIDGRVNRFRFFGDSLGYAVGEFVYKYTDSTASGIDGGGPGSAFAIESVYPQPSGGPITIRYTQAVPDIPRIEVFDGLGKRVAALKPTDGGTGVHDIVWQASAARGSTVPAGVYFVRISSGRSVAETAIVVTSTE
jgi:photosystem II stability/assembly factor-like uncharacterized protein